MNDDRSKKYPNPYKLVSLKTKRQNFVYWVFEDPDFQQDVTKLDSWFKKIQAVAKPESPNWRSEVAEGLIERKKQICKKYSIHDDELSLYYYSLHEWYGFNSGIMSIKVSEVDEASVSVTMLSNITRSEYIDAWKDIQQFIKDEYPKRGSATTKTKRKQEADYQLIYAINKALRSGIKYSAIYKLYEDGNLPCYTEVLTQRFQTPKELNDYYLRYYTFGT